MVYRLPPKYGPAERALIGAILDRDWRGAGGAVWDACDSLGSRIGADERTVRRALKALRAAGLLEVSPRPGRTSEIRVNENRLAELARTAEQPNPGQIVRGKARANRSTPDKMSDVPAPEPRTECPTTPDKMSDHPGQSVRTTPDKMSDELRELNHGTNSGKEQQQQQLQQLSAPLRWNGAWTREQGEALLAIWNRTGRRASHADLAPLSAALGAVSLAEFLSDEDRADPVAFLLRRAKVYCLSEQANSEGGGFKATLRRWLLPVDGRYPRCLETDEDWNPEAARKERAAEQMTEDDASAAKLAAGFRLRRDSGAPAIAGMALEPDDFSPKPSAALAVLLAQALPAAWRAADAAAAVAWAMTQQEPARSLADAVKSCRPEPSAAAGAGIEAVPPLWLDSWRARFDAARALHRGEAPPAALTEDDARAVVRAAAEAAIAARKPEPSGDGWRALCRRANGNAGGDDDILAQAERGRIAHEKMLASLSEQGDGREIRPAWRATG